MKPDCLNLTSQEERLISPRIPFMQICELPRGGQLSIHGNVVNVPADVNSTVNTLPRPLNESQTILIKLKRRLNFKHHYQYQNVRPARVFEAANYLIKNSKLFQSEHIEIQENWQDNVIQSSDETEEWQQFLHNPDQAIIDYENKKNDDDMFNQDSNGFCITRDIPSVTETETNDDTCSNTNDDNWCEVEERPSGVSDTMLQHSDTTENLQKVLSFAPGECNRPIGVFMDKDSEFLSFPTIYCGETWPDNKERHTPVHYSTICKWELRS